LVVINHLRRLNFGNHSSFEIDNFIINGKLDNVKGRADEYEELFKPGADLDNRRFSQERDSYLRGGASSPRPEEEHEFLFWMPHCRRKLFFEWRNTEQANRLVPFVFLPQFLQLLEKKKEVPDRVKKDLILGLNRAFSKLYITEENSLYVTTQYAHTIEQPIPIVRLKLPADNIDFRSDGSLPQAYDYNRHALKLAIYPPARIQHSPLQWQVALLRFEYLMRLAQGGTFNILSEECELAIRQLKDALIAAFASSSDERKSVTFFVAERNHYALHELWINDEGKIQV